MSSLRLPWRLAQREVRRRPGRTLLVALLVALPVAGMVIAVTVIRTDQRTPLEKWEEDVGKADAVVYPSYGDDGVALPTPALPAGSRTVTVTSGFERFRTADREHRSDVVLTDRPLDDPMTSGRLDLRSGRAPDAASEIALVPRVARDLGVAVGDELVLDRPALRLRVVGLIDDPLCLDCRTALVAPGHLDASFGPNLGTELLVDLPDLSASQLDSLRSESVLLEVDAISPHRDLDDGGTEAVRWSLVLGAVALMVMGIVISAAFAVGARRQLVTLGQLSASGASPGVLRAGLVLQGTITGVVGATAGSVLGVVGLLAFQPQVEQVLNHRIDGYTLRLTDVVGAVAIGVLAATLAALLPARTASRLPTLAALAGRRPLTPVPTRLVAAGVASVAVGLSLLGLAVVGNAGGRSGNLWALVAIAGGVCELAGACAIAPALVSRLEPLAARLRGSWKLAARGLARNRTRTGAVVAAVAAAGALAVIAGGLVRGNAAQEVDYLQPSSHVVMARRIAQVPVPGDLNGATTTTYSLPDPAVDAGLGVVVPDATRTVLRTATFATTDREGGTQMWTAALFEANSPGFSSFGFDEALVADDAVLDEAGLSSSDRKELEQAGFAWLERHDGPMGQLVAADGARTFPIPIIGVPHSVGSFTLLITPAKADALHLPVQPSAVLYRSPRALDRSTRVQLDDLQIDQAYEGNVGETYIADQIVWRIPDSGLTSLQLELLLTSLALLFSLFVVGASLALAAAESRDERDVLTVAGAPPSSLARAAGARAALLAGIGGLLAVPIGFLPVVVYARTVEGHFPLIFPGRTVLILLVAVPAVVGAVALVTSASAQRLRPVRVSTATFE